MSAKTIIQSLEDAELIRIFLEFVQTYRLQYEKIHKEISYKCYEATWILVIAKATGYGRTQTEAYKNALKNLLELVMEDPNYVEFFTSALPRNGQYQKNSSKMQLKTEGHEPDKQNRNKIYENSTKQYLVKENKRQKQRQEVYHSKITLNKSLTKNDQNQLEEAKMKLKNLENRLEGITNENKILRQKLLNFEQSSKSKKIDKIEQKKLDKFEDKKIVVQFTQKPFQLHQRYSHQRSEKNLLLNNDKLQQVISKIAVPKLNLEVLPNYHKKSQKCLNEVLMAAYNEKYGEKKIFTKQ